MIYAFKYNYTHNTFKRLIEAINNKLERIKIKEVFYNEKK